MYAKRPLGGSHVCTTLTRDMGLVHTVPIGGRAQSLSLYAVADPGEGDERADAKGGVAVAAAQLNDFFASQDAVRNRYCDKSLPQ